MPKIRKQMEEKQQEKIQVIDPIEFQKMIWPKIVLAKEQKKVLYSLMDNIVTYVPASNELGKDFITAMAIIWFLCSRRPARGAATSVSSDQLEDVLWGEIRRLMDSAEFELPLQYNHLLLRQTYNDGRLVAQGEFRGQVTKQGEAVLGKHLPGHEVARTLFCVDEASGVDTVTYDSAVTWADRILVIGNPLECRNFFFNAVKAGDVPNPAGPGFFRKIIRIKAEDSPNVRYQQDRIRRGLEPNDEVLIPGMITYSKYVLRRATWDPIRQTQGLDAEFYEGTEVKMYPAEWCAKSREKYLTLNRNRKATAMGIDCAAGGDDTSFWLVDDQGVVQYINKKTPDTTVITSLAKSLIKLHDISPRKVLLDSGGGGKQIADQLRLEGYKVQTVSFAETPSKPRRVVRKRSRRERQEEMERKVVFKNRRAEMYYELRLRIQPNSIYHQQHGVFALPPMLTKDEELLWEEMDAIPLRYDPEEKIWLPPKRQKNRDDRGESLEKILGRSPDRLDALVLAVFALSGKKQGSRIGVI